MSSLPSKIFNGNKTDYEKPSLFFGQDAGLLDTINKHYPELWRLYKTLKKLDWDENEFDYKSCLVEFKTCDRATYDMMIKTLAWQWEADSVASRSITTILGPVVNATEVWTGYVRINDNENVHALTYSEITRNSFDNPEEILAEILKVRESQDRLVCVAEVMHEAHLVSHKYALGLIEADQEAYNAIFMFVVAMFVLERIQFMASFAVTFAICDTGMFQPIGKAVQKIAQDEFEIHVAFGMEILRIELGTDRGRAAFEQCRGKIFKLINEVIASEITWVKYLFSEGRELTGVNADLLEKWVLFNGRAVYTFFDLEAEAPHVLPSKNPLPFIVNWLDISKNQSSPQEEQNNQYKVNLVQRDDADHDFAAEMMFNFDV